MLCNKLFSGLLLQSVKGSCEVKSSHSYTLGLKRIFQNSATQHLPELFRKLSLDPKSKVWVKFAFFSGFRCVVISYFQGCCGSLSKAAVKSSRVRTASLLSSSRAISAKWKRGSSEFEITADAICCCWTSQSRLDLLPRNFHGPFSDAMPFSLQWNLLQNLHLIKLVLFLLRCHFYPFAF